MLANAITRAAALAPTASPTHLEKKREALLAIEEEGREVMERRTRRKLKA